MAVLRIDCHLTRCWVYRCSSSENLCLRRPVSALQAVCSQMCSYLNHKKTNSKANINSPRTCMHISCLLLTVLHSSWTEDR